MKSIMISIKPKWCVLILNGDKTIEIRKNKVLANAIQKLIDENGYADIYVYCSKDKKNYLYKDYDEGTTYEKAFVSDEKPLIETPQLLNGKVLFKFRCYKVEKIHSFRHTPSFFCPYKYLYYAANNSPENLKKLSCLDHDKLHLYLKGEPGYAIHISDLEIFDRPKELSEFHKVGYGEAYDYYMNVDSACGYPCFEDYMKEYKLTKAPQNFCYIEGELE